MTKKYLLFLLIIILTLTSCQTNYAANQETRFIGESDNWEAVFIEEFIEVWDKNNGNNYSNEISNKVLLTYKNLDTDLSKIEVAEIKYEARLKSGSANENKRVNDNGQITYKLSGSKNGTIIRDYETIKLYVKWNDSEENIMLTAQ